MIISDSHRFIFIAVPKTGSSSVENALTPYEANTTRRFNKHATSLKLIRELPGEVWDSYFKFAFVRNPYDRIESLYYYRKRPGLANPDHPRHKMYTGDKTFEEFVMWFTTQHTIELNQIDFIAPNGGGLLLNAYGRFESLEADFSAFCSRLELPKLELPHVRASERDSSSDVWTPQSRRIINDYCAPDFEFFDYAVIEP